MAVIFVASSLPNLTRLPGGISDKTGHFAGYALLGGLVLRALARSRWQGVTRWAALQAWGICLVYGASDELHQWFVPGRSTAFDDWLADAAGAAFAVTVVRLVAGAIGRGRDRTV